MVIKLNELIEKLIKKNKNKNNFWKNGELTQFDVIKKNIITIMNFFDEFKNGSNEIIGVYLFGSVYKLRKSQYYGKTPNDFDIYFWLKNSSDSNFIKKIQNKYMSLPRAYNLKPHVLVFSCPPYDNTEFEGGVSGSLSSVYTLYENRDLSNLYYNKLFKKTS